MKKITYNGESKILIALCNSINEIIDNLGNAAASEAAAKKSEENAAASEKNAKASETAAAASQTAAKSSETNAASSAASAKTSESNAEKSAAASSNSATLSQSWAVGGTSTRDGEDTDNSKYYAAKSQRSAENAATSEKNAKASETSASESAVASGTSESNAAASEKNAKASELAASESKADAALSESNAKASETAAGNSAAAAETSETNAKTSETNAKASESNAAASETNAKASETAAKASATNAATSASSASQSAESAQASESSARTSATSAAQDADRAEQAAGHLQAEVDAVNEVIAPVQLTLTASQPYAIGEQFIYDGKLYTATSAIAEGGTITIGTNAALSTEIVKQIKSAKDAIGNLPSLTTDNKTSAVAAINEVDAHADNAQATANTASSKADIVQTQVSDSSDAYNPTKSYKIGDLCIYNNVLYRCVTACSAGSWATNQSCFTADTLVNVVNDINSDLNEYELIYQQTDAYTVTRTIYRQGRVVVFTMQKVSQSDTVPAGEMANFYIPIKYAPKHDLVCNSISQDRIPFNIAIYTDGHVLGWVYTDFNGQAFATLTWSI